MNRQAARGLKRPLAVGGVVAVCCACTSAPKPSVGATRAHEPPSESTLPDAASPIEPDAAASRLDAAAPRAPLDASSADGGFDAASSIEWRDAGNPTDAAPWDAFGTTELTSLEALAGAHAWQIGGSDDDEGTAIALGLDGSIYVTGNTRSATSAPDAFVAKYDALGNELWFERFGSNERFPGAASGTDLALDMHGNIYVVGYVRNGGFVHKFDSEGNSLWTQSTATAMAVVIDEVDAVYVAGHAETALGSNAGGDGFVRKFDSEGNALWSRQFGTSDVEHVRSIALGADRTLWITGQVASVVGAELPSKSDVLVGQIDRDGSYAWFERRKTSWRDHAFAVALDAEDRVYVAGEASPADGTSEDADAFVNQLNADASEAWSTHFGSYGRDAVYTLAFDRAGNVLSAGETPSVTSQTTGYENAFVRALDRNGEVLWTKVFGSSERDYIHDMAVDEAGVVHVVGTTYGAISGESHGQKDAFVLRFPAP